MRGGGGVKEGGGNLENLADFHPFFFLLCLFWRCCMSGGVPGGRGGFFVVEWKIYGCCVMNVEGLRQVKGEKARFFSEGVRGLGWVGLGCELVIWRRRRRKRDLRGLAKSK